MLGVLGFLGSAFRVLGSGFRVQGSGFWVLGSGFRVQPSHWSEKFTRLRRSAGLIDKRNSSMANEECRLTNVELRNSVYFIFLKEQSEASGS
jgi:hypothetical protein